jgi:hypothetical protein
MDTKVPANQSESVWDPSGVAGYMAVSLTKTARECAWPDDLRGNAARLLIQDLGEFGQAMVACGRANFWSPAKALERMFIERVEVLMGASVKVSVARRYLDTIAKPAGVDEPVKPASKARSEDAFETYVRAVRLSPERRQEFRRQWLALKAISSDWFVHPTAMGPLLSAQVQADAAEAAENWGLLIQVLASGCVWAITAANPLKVTLHVELVHSIEAATKCLEELGSPNWRGVGELHSFFAERVSVKDPNAAAG